VGVEWDVGVGPELHGETGRWLPARPWAVALPAMTEHPSLASWPCTAASDPLAVGLQALGARQPGGELPLPRSPLTPGQGPGQRIAGLPQELPAARRWPLGRAAVATGPGGITAPRLTVLLARTLAQQLQLSLDGFHSFLLSRPSPLVGR